MSTKPVVYPDTAIDLAASPIDPGWIIDGNPSARNSIPPGAQNSLMGAN